MQKKSVIVGIPSYNEADSISYVVKQVDDGLYKYFQGYDCIIVNVDNFSPDNTKDAFLSTPTRINKKYITTPKGIKGKGNNILNLFRYASEIRADAVVIVDADLKSITPEWVERLASPILEGKDFISPLYLRHKFDGTITNNIVFPLVYSLFGKNLRQPIGGEFAFSGKLVEHYLEQEWSETTRQFGIDIFLTLNALIGGFNCDEVYLGAKIHKPSAPKLNDMFVQVVNSFFELLVNNKDSINKILETQVTDLKYSLPREDIEGLSPDFESMDSHSLKEFELRREHLKNILDERLFARLEKTFKDGRVDAMFWSEIVFYFLSIYKNHEDKTELVKAFRPIYFRATYHFMEDVRELENHEAEEVVLERAKNFYLCRDKFVEA